MLHFHRLKRRLHLSANIWRNLLVFSTIPLIALTTFWVISLTRTARAPTLKNGSGNTLYSASNATFGTSIGTKDGEPKIGFTVGKAEADFVLAGSDKVKPKKESGTTVLFPSVQKDTDLRYTTTLTGIKEELVIHTRPDHNVYLFDLLLKNVVPKKLINNVIDPTFNDATGKYQFNFEKPFAVDAKGARTDNVILQISEDKALPGKYDIKLIVDQAWLSDPKRAYPVTLDPTVVHNTTSAFAAGYFNRIKDIGSGASPALVSYYQQLSADQYTVGLWHFDEASGNITDSSGNGNTGTPTGTGVVTGFIGNARSFTTSSDYITVADSSSLKLTSNFSFESWVYPTSLANTFNQIFIKNSANTTYYGMLINSSGTITVQLSTIGSGTSTGTVPINKWSHIAATYDGANIQFYINGILDSTVAATGTMATSTAQLDIGRDSVNASRNFVGYLDELRISSIARSAEEIKADASRRPSAVYTSPVIDFGVPIASWNSLSWTESGVHTADGETVGNTTNLVSQWNLNSTSGTTATSDAGSCGSTCNGTLTNFASTGSQDAAAGTGWTAVNGRWPRSSPAALMFDGTDDWVNVGNRTALQISGALSIEAWVKTSATGGYKGFVSKMLHASFGYVLRESGAAGKVGNAEFGISSNGSTFINVLGTTPINDGEWHYIVGTYVPSTSLNIYIDGILQNSNTTSIPASIFNTAAPVGIGNTYATEASTEFLNGVIDSPRIYSRTLNGAEIMSNYQAGNVDLQTRVGNTTDPNDGSWEAWKPTTAETSIDNMDNPLDYATPSASLFSGTLVATSAATLPAREGTKSLGIQTGKITSYNNTVGLWHFDETDGGGAYLKDSSGNNNNGTPSGTATVNGIVGKGRSFNGTSDYIEVPDSASLEVTSNFTLEAWIYRSVDSGTWERIVSKSNNFTGYDYWMQIERNDTLNCGVVKTDTSFYTESSVVTIPLSTWTHVACTFNANFGWNLYVNGEISTDPASVVGTLGPARTTPSNVEIGRLGNGDKNWYYSFTGLIDEVRISNVTRGNEEIAEDYRLGGNHYINKTIASTDLSGKVTLPFYVAADRPGSYLSATVGNSAFANGQPDGNTIGLWHLDEPVDNEATFSIKDSSGNGNNGLGSTPYAGYWKMDEPSGTTVADSSGANNTGTATGTTIVAGINGNARNFSVASDVIDAGSAANLTSIAAFTVCAWVKPNSAGVNGSGRIYFKGTGVAAATYDSLYISNSNTVSITAGYATANVLATSANNSITFGVWQYLCGVWSGGTTAASLKLYINGNLATLSVNTAGSGARSNTGNVIIGNRAALDRPFDGPIDEVQVYNYALSAAQIETSMTYQFGPQVTAAGKIGNARAFNGTSDSISIPNSTAFDTQTLTMSAWVYSTNYTQNGFIFEKGPVNTQYSCFFNTTPANLYFRTENGSGTTDDLTLAVSNIPANQWSYIACTYDGAHKSIYVNGILAATEVYSQTLKTGQNGERIGAYGGPTPSFFFNGSIDEVRVDNIARSAASIRQAYEIGARTHQITIDFGAKLDGTNLIYDSSDLGFTIDATYYGLEQKGDALFPRDKIIVRENINGTEYLAQGTVNSVIASTGAVTVAAWDTGSTFPPSGYTINASIFKWQREFWNITGPISSQVNAVTNLTLRTTNGSEGRSIWLDDLRSAGDYLTTPAGSTTTSSTGNRYFQYRTILSSFDEAVSATVSAVTVDYVLNSTPATPSLDTPANSATNQSLTPALKTTATDTDGDYLRYKIQLCTDVGMTTACQTFDQTSSQTGWSGQNAQISTAYTSGTQGVYTIQSALTPGTTYYWRSYAIDPAGTNTFSGTQSPHSFTTTAAPTAPTTPWAQGSTNPTGLTVTTPTFSAIHNDPDGDSANQYQIQVNTNNTFTGTVMWDSGQTSMSALANGVRSTNVTYAGTTLTNNGLTYYWRIRFTDILGAVGAWSATQNFSMNQPPATPSLDLPANTATNVITSPLLKTTALDADSDYLRYKIQLCTDVGMTTACQTFDQTSSQTGWSGQNAQISTAYTSGTQGVYTIQSALTPGTTYYWRSYAIDPGGSNTFSATQTSPNSFTTVNAPLTATDCRLKENNIDSSILLSWTDNATTEDAYEVQRSVDGGAFAVLQTSMAANSTSLTDATISQGHTYAYRVAPYLATGPVYASWCTTNTLSIRSGLFDFSGLKLNGLKFN